MLYFIRTPLPEYFEFQVLSLIDSHWMQVITAVIGLLSASVAAVPLEKKDSCVYICGSVCYWQSDIDAAVSRGYELYSSGDQESR